MLIMYPMSGKKGPQMAPKGDCRMQILGVTQQAAPGDCHCLFTLHAALRHLGLGVSTSTRCQGRTD